MGSNVATGVDPEKVVPVPMETAPAADRRRTRPSPLLPSSAAISRSLVEILACLTLAAAASTLAAFDVRRVASLPAPAPALAAAAILLLAGAAFLSVRLAGTLRRQPAAPARHAH